MTNVSLFLEKSTASQKCYIFRCTDPQLRRWLQWKDLEAYNSVILQKIYLSKTSRDPVQNEDIIALK